MVRPRVASPLSQHPHACAPTVRWLLPDKAAELSMACVSFHMLTFMDRHQLRYESISAGAPWQSLGRQAGRGESQHLHSTTLLSTPSLDSMTIPQSSTHLYASLQSHNDRSTHAIGPMRRRASVRYHLVENGAIPIANAPALATDYRMLQHQHRRMHHHAHGTQDIGVVRGLRLRGWPRSHRLSG